MLAVLPSASGAQPRAVYALNGHQVGQYAIGDDGNLAGPVARTPSGSPFGRMAASLDSKHVYVPIRDAIEQFDVRPDGALAPMVQPTAPATGGLGEGVAVTPNGRYVYAVYGRGSDGDPGSISQYSVGPNGALTPLKPAAITTPAGSAGIAVSPDGRSAYVANGGNAWHAQGTISQFLVGADGLLKPMSTPTVNAGENTEFLAITPDGKHLYASSFIESTISQYDVMADGSLTPMSSPTVHVDNEPFDLTVSPDGKNLYAAAFHTQDAKGADAIAQFTVGDGGMLKPMSPTLVDAAGNYLENLAYSPYGRHLFGGGAEFTAGPDGALTRTAKTGPLAGFAIPSARRATASFTVSKPPAGVPAFLDAEATTAGIGEITSYNWNFGDGTTQKRALPDVGHVYKKPGKYTVTLEVATTGDCSQTVYTGTQMLCVAGTQWKTTRPVTITKPATVSSSRGGDAALSAVQVKRSGMVEFALVVPHTGTVTVTSSATSWQRGGTTGRRTGARRFVLARRHRAANGAATMVFRLKPDARGRRLISRHKGTVAVRLRVRYQPRHGRGRTFIRTVRVPR